MTHYITITATVQRVLKRPIIIFHSFNWIKWLFIIDVDIWFYGDKSNSTTEWSSSILVHVYDITFNAYKYVEIILYNVILTFESTNRLK